MAITYQDRQLVGSNKIKDEYTKINSNSGEIDTDLNSLQGQIDSLVLGSANATIGAYPITASGTDTYTGTFTNLTYFAGLFINLYNITDNTGSSTFNLNSLGAKDIKVREADGTKRDVVAGEMADEVSLFYDGTDFIIIANHKKLEEQSLTPKQTGGGYLINGNFDVWQRGTTFNTPATNSFLADRFSIVIGGGTSSGTFDVTKTKMDSSDPNVRLSNYYLRHNQTVIGDRTDVRYRTILEDLPLFIGGKTLTMGFWIRSSIALNFNLNLRTDFGTGGSPSSDQQIIQNIVYTNLNQWEKIEFTHTFDYTGNTFGTNEDATLILQWQDLTEINTNICTFDLAQLKLEIGNKATTFIPKTFSEELRDCQRYYYVNELGNVVAQGDTDQIALQIQEPVKMRLDSPTFILNDALYAHKYDGSQVITIHDGLSTLTQGLSASFGQNHNLFLTATGATQATYSLNNSSSLGNTVSGEVEYALDAEL